MRKSKLMNWIINPAIETAPTASGITTTNYYTYKMSVKREINVSTLAGVPVMTYPLVVFTVDTNGNVWSFDNGGTPNYVINWTNDLSWTEDTLMSHTDAELAIHWGAYV